ncbi:MAG: YebC/PmpR family DNA-binding transcriptional regulator [Dehalococcoidia bacterium]|nr:YebC/PmpR family DNA-binding transcriptional regulator [Dehalococcoidia bacterium]
MSGHSKWAQIKRQKAGNDAKRGQMFTKLGREIEVATRDGGGDPDANVRLRFSIQRARSFNMPADNIERAIKRGLGETDDAVQYDEITYEGYAPGGAALYIEVVTDNRNRAVAEVRSVLNRSGGSLGESGCVAWNFDQRGVVIGALTAEQDADDLTLAAIDAGALDVMQDNGTLEVHTVPTDLEAGKQALEGEGLEVTEAEVTFIPKSTVKLDSRQTVQVMRLIEQLEEFDDVQRVHTNLDISEAPVAKAA